MEALFQNSPVVREAALSTAFENSLAPETLHAQAPAVFAPSAHMRTSAAYTFISTERLLAAFQTARFLPVSVRQARTRTADELYARHVVRLRRRFETVRVKDVVPEIVFFNSHDGRSAYQLRFGLFRAVCSNGMIIAAGSFAAFRARHRGDVVGEIIQAALGMCERFDALSGVVEQMERKRLADEERISFAEGALRLRYPDLVQAGMQPSQLLTCRRPADVGHDLWRTYNVVQENLLRGGQSRRSASGRLARSRRITAIREDVRLNVGLWDLAMAALAA